MSQSLGEPVAVASVQDRVAHTDAGELRLRIYHPAPGELRPVVVFFHGGGFVLGDLDTHDGLARALAEGGGSVVVAVDYPLAPEHKYPAAPRAAYAAVPNMRRHSAGMPRSSPSAGIAPEEIWLQGSRYRRGTRVAPRFCSSC
jgi:acetyl esterase